MQEKDYFIFVSMGLVSIPDVILCWWEDYDIYISLSYDRMSDP